MAALQLPEKLTEEHYEGLHEALNTFYNGANGLNNSEFDGQELKSVGKFMLILKQQKIHDDFEAQPQMLFQNLFGQSTYKELSEEAVGWLKNFCEKYNDPAHHDRIKTFLTKASVSGKSLSDLIANNIVKEQAAQRAEQEARAQAEANQRSEAQARAQEQARQKAEQEARAQAPEDPELESIRQSLINEIKKTKESLDLCEKMIYESLIESGQKDLATNFKDISQKIRKDLDGLKISYLNAKSQKDLARAAAESARVMNDDTRRLERLTIKTSYSQKIKKALVAVILVPVTIAKGFGRFCSYVADKLMPSRVHKRQLRSMQGLAENINKRANELNATREAVMKQLPKAKPR